MKTEDRYAHQKDAIVWNLVSIENDISKLSVMLKSQTLHKEQEIHHLLNEIETMAKDCRKRLISLDFKAYESDRQDEETAVTQKEIRELLEAFA